MSRSLITGGCGDVGYYLAQREVELGNQVTIVDNFSRGKWDEDIKAILSHRDVNLIEGDLCDSAFVNSLPVDYDYVFHLAAMNGTANFYERPFTVLENCTLPTIFLLRHFAKSSQIRRFLYAGSSEVYASTVKCFNWPVPTDETAPLCIENPANLRWSYGASKLHGEVAVFNAAKQFNLPVSIVRFHNVYGPRMSDKHVIPDFIARAQKGIYELHGYMETRAFIYVTDAVEACRLVAESEDAIGEIVHIGNEDEITMLKLGKTILKLMGKEGTIACYDSPRGSVPRRTPKVDKLFQLTGFRSAITLEEGLRLVLDSKNIINRA